MALVLADRIKETTTTTGTGTYTLAGAVTGFESFATIGNTNTTYYCCTDGTDFEVGVGTYASSGTTLARTTILQSSNSDAAVNWSAGTRSIFCTQPAEKAVFLDGNGNVALGGDLTLSNAGDVTLTLEADTDNVTETDNPSLVLSQDGGGTVSKLRLNSGNDTILEAHTNGDLHLQDSSARDYFKGIPAGAVELYHNNSKKLETTSAGATVTGTLTSGGVFSNGSISDSQSAKGVYIGLSGSGDAQLSLVGDNTDVSPQIDFSHDVNVDYDVRLILQDSGNRLAIVSHNGSSAENMARFVSDGAVELYHNNVKKLQTTADGVDIISTDDGSSIGPKLHLYRNSASPADFDDMGGLAFTANNSAGDRHEYSLIRSEVADVTDGSEDAYIQFFTNVGGSSLEHMALAFGGTTITGQLYLKGNTIHSNPHLKFEGSSANAHETTFNVTDPTADRTITLPDATGEVVLKDSSDVVTITSTDAGAGAGPDVSLYRNSASPAVNDDIGQITFDGNDDAGQKIEYARIDTTIVDVQNSNPDGQLDFAVTRNGVSTIYQRMAFGLSQFYQNIYLGINLSIIFEGTAYNDFEIYLTAANPTADRTITLPDATGTVLTTGNSDTPTTTTSSSDADFVLVDDGGTMKKITPANLGITAGAASTDDATALAIALG